MGISGGGEREKGVRGDTVGMWGCGEIAWDGY